MNAEEKQQNLLELQQLQHELERISQQQEMINQQLLDLDISKNALKTINQTKIGTEILAQVSNGIFVKSTLAENQKLIVNIGSNVTVEKTVDEVVSMLDEQNNLMIDNSKMIDTYLENISQQIMSKINLLEEQENKIKTKA